MRLVLSGVWAVVFLSMFCVIPLHSQTQPVAVEQWDIFELALPGPVDGNPFDTKLSAKFTGDGSTIDVRGFYDGQGIYRIRFSPPKQGAWKYETASDRAELSGKTGAFTCTKPTGNNHGPVVARNIHHFAYLDGTPFFPISTTLYGWVHQRSNELQEQTLATLKSSPFNRIRMMVTPITYAYDNIPHFFPFEENRDESWIYEKFDPRYFQAIEKRVMQLRDMGIQAELILLHSRDGGRTQLDRMPAHADDRYIRYCLARFSAFRNVWWSLANEFDNMRFKRDEDWNRFFQIISSEDPHQWLRSVHQMRRYYDVNKPWVTHLSVQSELAVTDFGRPAIYRQLFRKPIVFDEPKYEGDIPETWGNLSGEEMTFRFWICTIAGTYAAHGETYENAPGVRWISRGGKLVGKSPQRIAFLKQIIDAGAVAGLTPMDPDYADKGIAGTPGQYYLIYFGKEKPTEWPFELPGGRIRAGTKFKVDVIDTWNMTITPLEQPVTIGGQNDRERYLANPPMSVPLPGKQYMALRIQRVQ
jgi:Domain of unknown function (DUF5605)/Domain of unknown function (DUF5060)/Protein of unknown function (DUF4038)